ncbi:unnamed protein product [Cylicocyclus nassatus]|uniref:Uncharacterized protein n=1 Tax=Cylicocyclus nassatus TaxID=53992 RepID=A0AA36HEU9_CYLNA|nr:unnamed protein product [Cylicocyclus nassatus]
MEKEIATKTEQLKKLEGQVDAATGKLQKFTEDQEIMDEQYREIYHRNKRLELKLRQRVDELDDVEKMKNTYISLHKFMTHEVVYDQQLEIQIWWDKEESLLELISQNKELAEAIHEKEASEAKSEQTLVQDLRDRLGVINKGFVEIVEEHWLHPQKSEIKIDYSPKKLRAQDMVSPFRVGRTVDARRLSVNDSYKNVENNLRKTVAKLNELWDQVHMSESARVARVGVAFGHITNLLSNMVASEENMVAAVGTDIENGLNKIDRMRSQLKMEPWENTEAPPGSIELAEPVFPYVCHFFMSVICKPKLYVGKPVVKLKSIEKELKKLTPLYETRKREQDQLLEQLTQLLNRLGIDDEIVTDENVSSSLDPDDENLQVIFKLDFTKEDVCFSETMMGSIETYHAQLKEMYCEHVQEKEFRWTELHAQLTELWDHCHVADIERTIPASYDPESHTEKDFEEMSNEICRLKCLYEARKEVCDVLTKWKDKWAEKISVEEKKKNVNYFQNCGRGNNVFLDAKVLLCALMAVWAVLGPTV